MRYCLPFAAALVVILSIAACEQNEDVANPEARIKTDAPILGVYR